MDKNLSTFAGTCYIIPYYLILCRLLQTENTPTGLVPRHITQDAIPNATPLCNSKVSLTSFIYVTVTIEN